MRKHCGILSILLIVSILVGALAFAVSAEEQSDFVPSAVRSEYLGNNDLVGELAQKLAYRDESVIGFDDLGISENQMVTGLEDVFATASRIDLTTTYAGYENTNKILNASYVTETESGDAYLELSPVKGYDDETNVPVDAKGNPLNVTHYYQFNTKNICLPFIIDPGHTKDTINPYYIIDFDISTETTLPSNIYLYERIIYPNGTPATQSIRIGSYLDIEPGEYAHVTLVYDMDNNAKILFINNKAVYTDGYIVSGSERPTTDSDGDGLIDGEFHYFRLNFPSSEFKEKDSVILDNISTRYAIFDTSKENVTDVIAPSLVDGGTADWNRIKAEQGTLPKLAEIDGDVFYTYDSMQRFLDGYSEREITFFRNHFKSFEINTPSTVNHHGLVELSTAPGFSVTEVKDGVSRYSLDREKHGFSVLGPNGELLLDVSDLKRGEGVLDYLRKMGTFIGEENSIFVDGNGKVYNNVVWQISPDAQDVGGAEKKQYVISSMTPVANPLYYAYDKYGNEVQTYENTSDGLCLLLGVMAADGVNVILTSDWNVVDNLKSGNDIIYMELDSEVNIYLNGFTLCINYNASLPSSAKQSSHRLFSILSTDAGTFSVYNGNITTIGSLATAHNGSIFYGNGRGMGGRLYVENVNFDVNSAIYKTKGFDEAIFKKCNIKSLSYMDSVGIFNLNELSVNGGVSPEPMSLTLDECTIVSDSVFGYSVPVIYITSRIYDAGKNSHGEFNLTDKHSLAPVSVVMLGCEILSDCQIISDYSHVYCTDVSLDKWAVIDSEMTYKEGLNSANSFYIADSSLVGSSLGYRNNMHSEVFVHNISTSFAKSDFDRIIYSSDSVFAHSSDNVLSYVYTDKYATVSWNGANTEYWTDGSYPHTDASKYDSVCSVQAGQTYNFKEGAHKDKLTGYKANLTVDSSVKYNVYIPLASAPDELFFNGVSTSASGTEKINDVEYKKYSLALSPENSFYTIILAVRYGESVYVRELSLVDYAVKALAVSDNNTTHQTRVKSILKYLVESSEYAAHNAVCSSSIASIKKLYADLPSLSIDRAINTFSQDSQYISSMEFKCDGGVSLVIYVSDPDAEYIINNVKYKARDGVVSANINIKKLTQSITIKVGSEEFEYNLAAYINTVNSRLNSTTLTEMQTMRYKDLLDTLKELYRVSSCFK